jgi:hypothetical protein
MFTQRLGYGLKMVDALGPTPPLISSEQLLSCNPKSLSTTMLSRSMPYPPGDVRNYS